MTAGGCSGRTVEALAEHFPVALTELVDEAITVETREGESDGVHEELALVDLSAE